MNRKNVVLLTLALLVMGSGVVILGRLKSHQRLGPPAVKTSPVANSIRLAVDLPETVGGLTSEPLEVSQIVLDTLPADTSFGQRVYRSTNGFETLLNVVLMGADRTSIHTAEFCLQGQGWRIDRAASEFTKISMEKPRPYELPVMKFIATKDLESGGQKGRARGVYAFWFVAPNELTANYGERMWWMARDLLTRGELQRWAYVSLFSVCEPGKEAAVFEQMQSVIRAVVPAFQLTPEIQQASGVSPTN